VLAPYIDAGRRSVKCVLFVRLQNLQLEYGSFSVWTVIVQRKASRTYETTKRSAYEESKNLAYLACHLYLCFVENVLHISGVCCDRVTLTTVPLIDAKSQIKNHLHGIKTQIHSIVVIQGCMCTLISNGIREQVATVSFLAVTRDFILQHLVVCGVPILFSSYRRL
jgi:hypothetical protein